MSEEYIIVNAEIRNLKLPYKEPIKVRVACKFQYAVAMFSDKKLAKKLAKDQIRRGKDVRYDPKLNVVIEKFKGKTAKEVSEIISREMQKSGGTLK